jgi:VanZ family protein
VMNQIDVVNISGLKIYAIFLRIVCTLILAGMLVAGLWPFHSPRNRVTWLGEGAGLFLGKYGILMSAQPLRSTGSKRNTPCSFEVWLEPARVDKSGTILAYYRPDNFAVQVSLRQFEGNLMFGRGDLKYQQRVRFVGIYAAKVFRKHRPVLFSIATGEGGTAVYANGALVQRSSSFKFSSDDLTGQLMFGNAPATTDVWSGTLKAYAVYDRELSPDEVRQHYANWLHNDEKALVNSKGVIGVYPFSENSGSVVHNQVDPATNLLIPECFVVPHKQFLEAPWDEYHPTWSYWKSVAINVIGFIPLGFFFCALFHLASDVEHPVLATITLGFMVSLTIEALQGFLPTRSSGVTDLFTNTFGTAVGTVAYTSPAVRRCIGKLGRYARVPEDITK